MFDDFPDLFGPEPPPTILNITSSDNESYPFNLLEDDDATLRCIYFPFIVSMLKDFQGNTRFGRLRTEIRRQIDRPQSPLLTVDTTPCTLP